jgi:pimeloyl-ACP methyl ester carboxylesterase
LSVFIDYFFMNEYIVFILAVTQFHHFFAFTEMMPITEHFTIYHINAPGQEDRANPLPATSVYPTMEELAETVNDVFNHLNIKTAIGFGVGVGANILTRFALKYSSKIYGLILVNCISRGLGWFEGFTLKWPTKDMPQQTWTDALLTYLIWYHLGYETQTAHPDLVQGLRRHLEENVNAKNVIKLLNSFLKRTPIVMERPTELNKNADPPKSLTCTIMNITGFSSPHKDDVIETNDRCDPTKSSYVEFADCGGAVLEEQPAKTAEAIRLFLQGLGHISHISIPKFSVANRLTEQAAEYKRRNGPMARDLRRASVPFDSVDSGLYRPNSQEDDLDNDLNDYGNELQLRVDSFEDRNVKL